MRTPSDDRQLHGWPMAGMPIGLSWCTSRLRSIAPTASRYRKAPRSMKMLSRSRRLLAVLAVLLPAALVAPGAAWAAPVDPEITMSPDQPKTNQEVTFGVASPVSGVTYVWDTNHDGVFGQADDVATRTFQQSGEYMVSVKAIDDTTQEPSSVVSRTVSVTDPPPCPSTPGPGNGAPDAKFSVNNTQPLVGQPVRVRSRSTDPEGCALTYAWIADGGDALIEDAGAAITNVTFAQAGDWTLTLQVTDDAGKSTSVDRVIHVKEVPPPANQLPNVPTFSVSPASPTVNQLVTFKATASDPDGTIERIDWDFENDGSFDASGETVQRTFTSGGNTTVLVQVTDNRGGQRSSFQSVFIEGPQTTVVPQSSGLPPSGPTPTQGRTTTTTTPSGVRLLNPIIRLRGAIVGGRTRISLLQVYGAPRGAKVRARCRGGGCPKGLVVSTAQTSGRSIRLRAFERRLSPGATIEVFVTQSGRIGKYTRWRIMRTKAPIRTDRCIRSYGGKTSTCPSGD